MGNSKVWSLACVDYIVLIANKDKELKAMMKRLEHFLDRRKPNLNVEKCKTMVFKKRRGKELELERWKGRRDRQRNVVFGDKDAKNERMKRANVVMKQVWEIWERKFQNDFKRRMMLFDYLVVGVTLYWIELFGCKERIECERIP